MERRIFIGILEEVDSYSLMTSHAVWNAGTHAVHSRGKDSIAHKTKEIKHVLRAKGNFPTTLARSRSTLLVIFRIFPVLWIPAFQTPLLIISRVFPFLCFTTTHSLHSYVFSYSRVFDSCVPNSPLILHACWIIVVCTCVRAAESFVTCAS